MRGSLEAKSAIAAVVVLGVTVIFSTNAQAPASVWDGVYTEDQATGGAALYQPQCASCHGKALEGTGQNPPLAGDDFKTNWDGQPLGDLFEKMRTSMPADRPGKLSGEQNAAILAYMLKRNGFPAGSTPLKGDAKALQPVRFESEKPSK
jgi:mono/diheme cytochrome c family protein